MPDTPGAALVNRFLAAWLRDDLDAVMSCVTDDVEFCTLGGAKPAVTFRGREAVVRAFADRLGDDPDVTLGEPIDLADYVLGPWTSRSPDGSTMRGFDIYLIRDGLIAQKDVFGKVVEPLPESAGVADG